MSKISYRYGLILLLACLLLLGAAMLPVGIPPADRMPALIAQDATSTPAPTVEGTPETTATPQADATPGADIASSIENVASQAVSGLDDLSWGELVRILLTVVLIVLAVIYGTRLVSTLLRRLAKRTTTTFDDALLEALRPQIRWLIAAIGFQIATFQLEFISGFWQDVLQLTYFLLYWFVVMATLWRSIDFSVHWYIEDKGPDVDTNMRDQLLPLAARLGHGCLIIVAILALLGYFGVNMLALTAGLGLGGFAISLAAKDTITNVISGIVIMFDSPFKVGDRIDVPAAGTWGDVVDIGIRSTRVVTRDNRLVIIPNSLVVDGNVINYSEPDPSYRLQVDLGIGSGVDVPWVKQVLEDTARGVEGVLADKPVQVLFTGFGDSSNSFRVRWWVATPGEKRGSTDRVCAAIQKVADEKGIDMPYPIYALENAIKLSTEDVDQLSQALGQPSAPGGSEPGATTEKGVEAAT